MFKTCLLAVILSCLCTLPLTAHSAPQKFNFENTEVTDIIKNYATWTGQKFVIDQNVRGKVSIVNPAEINPEEAFALLSSALALNGYAIVTTGDTMRIELARNAVKFGTETVSELPPARPERMVTYVLNLKHATAQQLVRTFRAFASRDGMMFEASKNQIVMTDWVSNIHQIKRAIELIDRPNVKFEATSIQSRTTRPTEQKSESKTE